MSVMLCGFASQLRTALKASEEEKQPSVRPYEDWSAVLNRSSLNRRPAALPTPPEESGFKMAELVGGDYADVPTTAQIESKMPRGAHMIVTGQVFTLREDGRLHYNEEQTDRLKKKTVS